VQQAYLRCSECDVKVARVVHTTGWNWGPTQNDSSRIQEQRRAAHHPALAGLACRARRC
jgi:hypothetical protein